jgi:hypothetical protein
MQAAPLIFYHIGPPYGTRDVARMLPLKALGLDLQCLLRLLPRRFIHLRHANFPFDLVHDPIFLLLLAAVIFDSEIHLFGLLHLKKLLGYQAV